MSRSDALISATEIAVRLRMSKVRVWRLLRLGVIPAWRERPGGRWVIRRAEFEAWLSGCNASAKLLWRHGAEPLNEISGCARNTGGHLTAR